MKTLLSESLPIVAQEIAMKIALPALLELRSKARCSALPCNA